MGIITVLWEKWTEFRRDFYKITLAAMIAPLMYLIVFGMGIQMVSHGEPYLNFLKNFPIRGVDSFMRKIYSVYAGTSAQEQTAIMDLVERNNYLMDEAEKAKNAEALRPLDEMGYRVMGVIGAKMMVEMVVMFMQMVDKITNF